MIAHLLFHLVWRELTDRFAPSLLGAVWTVLLPLLQISIFLLVFSRLMASRFDGTPFGTLAYPLYLTSGMIPWLFIAGGCQRMASVWHEKRGLLAKTALPLQLFPLVVLTAEGVVAGIWLLFYLLLALLAGGQVAWLWLLWLSAALFCFLYGIGRLLALFGFLLPDLKEVVALSLQLLFWLTPIVYPPEALPETVKAGLERFNPAWWVVEASHAILFRGASPEPLHLIGLFGLGLLLLLLGHLLLRRSERVVRDLL